MFSFKLSTAPLLLALGLLGANGSALAQVQPANHALLISVADYARQPLPGVLKDKETASKLAQRFGVPEENITRLGEQSVTREGLQAAVTALEKRVMPGDRVYVMFSGHGARFFNAVTQACAESLVMQNMKLVTNDEFAAMLKPVGAKAGKVVVMIDACHSGGVATAASTRALLTQRPKVSKELNSPECSKPTNVQQFANTRGVALSTSNMNLVVMAAARNSEVAWDTDNGGAMMSNFMACVDGAAKDTDSSGTLSMKELANCTQQRLDQQQDDATRQHVVLTGNTGLTPGFIAAAPTPVVKPNPSPVPAPSPVVTPPVDNALAALTDIYNQRDERREVTVTVPNPRLKIGKDALDFNIRSSEAGYVYVFYRGSSPNSFYLLFPNTLDGNNQIAAGETLRLPRPNWRIGATGPEGKDHLLVMVTQNPRDFSSFALPKDYVSSAGAFTQIKPDAKALSAISRIASLSGQLQQKSACQQTGGKRDLAIALSCSDAFGAAQVTLEEVK
jgi:hypothetical protein